MNNLPDGTYTVVVTDANGCSASIITTLSDPAGPTVSIASTSVTCFNACNGTAVATPTGVGPFTIAWAAPLTSTVASVSSLCQGVYAVQVTDANGCVTSQTVAIAQPTDLVPNEVVSNSSCNAACDGSIVLTPTGGTAPYTYSWSPGGQTTATVTNLCAGTYTAQIGDANACTYTHTFSIVEPALLTFTVNKFDAKCFNACNGSAAVHPIGGTAPYTYNWSTGAVLDTVVNLCAGVYTVTVSDARGCSATGTVNIAEPAAITTTMTVSDAICFGQCNGSATVTATGGVAPYGYTWNLGPQTTPTVTGLCAGSYTNTVTDANGCSLGTAFTVNAPVTMTATFTPTSPKCFGSCDGAITTTVSGGSPSYTYNWLPAGGSSANPTNLCAGIYTLNVTDASGCAAQIVTTLANPTQVQPNVTTTNPGCFSACNGTAMSNQLVEHRGTRINGRPVLRPIRLTRYVWVLIH